MARTWLDASEAASRLGVKPATLYAYVSRGQLRRRTGPDGRRSEYHPQDVADLAVRGRRARPTRQSDVIVPTAITRIGRDGPVYRGRPATVLAGVEPFEHVVSWLWEGTEPVQWDDPRWSVSQDALAVARSATGHLGGDVAPADRLLPAVAALRLADPLRGDLRPDVVRGVGRRMLSTLACVVDGGGAAAGGPTEPMRIAQRMTAAVASPALAGHAGATSLVDAALVLLADHELAASTLAVRVAASARSDPYAAVLAGLAVVSGRRHGAASRPLEAAMAAIADGSAPAAALERVLRGDELPGFGHPLYPGGDPRADRLIALIGASEVADRAAPLSAIVDLARSRGSPEPNVDVALAGLTHAIGAPVGTGELLFALARIAGWLAHALEQYDERELLRPAAVYVGGRGDASS